jgi:hypothetical protein
VEKYTYKRPQNIPNDHKISERAANVQKNYKTISLQGTPKFTQIGIFGLKI